ncbi:multidrug transporter [Liquorilactobacillus capillatus]|uniref:N-acetylglucosamine galactosamine PTS, EIIA n=1 Tax=Liquorilactobacillus capillatus DSM 19910 TaxID=1423731 RepID=A0A0R1M044_9LACO|nr:multidrug transporter [Liquorilactobacillus capillatus]KRL00937.1 N-acetylglucosamine galactosamine PTS, EIIA [Liquorilactobacillus capillatus DSM 19910]
MKIIVTGHGNFATGIESTVKLLAGSIKNVTYIDFTAEMTEEELATNFTSILKKDPNIVFFCDLVGGTPYKQAVLEKENHNIAVVGGCNIGSLLEVGLQNDLTSVTNVHKIAEKLVTATKASVQEFGIQKPKINEDISNGI